MEMTAVCWIWVAIRSVRWRNLVSRYYDGTFSMVVEIRLVTCIRTDSRPRLLSRWIRDKICVIRGRHRNILMVFVIRVVLDF